MKKYIVLVVILLNCFHSVSSSPIDTITAKKVAINFMQFRSAKALEVLNVVVEKDSNETVLYIVNFREGGMVMVSASESTIPVIGFGYTGTYSKFDDNPEGLHEFLQGYKDQIRASKSIKASNEIKAKWDELKTTNLKKSLYTYTPPDRLLDTDRGWIMWSQSKNYSGTCSPRYNLYIRSGNCSCPNKPAGCGPIAMAQIMWYWEWPITSSYGSYDYSLMPDKLYDSHASSDSAEEVARFIEDLDVVNWSYFCSGVASTVNRIEDAFNEDFGYSSAKKHIKNDWDYGSAWEDLLRSEIDLGRPVLYRGDKNDISLSKHIFIIDAYHNVYPDYFGFNFGHGAAYYNVYWFYLDDISPDDYDWTKNQMAIVGISPTIEATTVEENINDVSYTSVTGIKSEYAQQQISLPASGKTLTIENGGELNLIAGDEISLNPGFEADPGGSFSLKDFDDLDVFVDEWINTFTPNGDGVNDELCFQVENADSWEFEVFNSWGSPVFQSAGTVSSNEACIWNGEGVSGTDSYACIVRFKNSYGRFVENAYMITVIF